MVPSTPPAALKRHAGRSADRRGIAGIQQERESGGTSRV
jgi:hypothetical protein